LKNNVVDAYIEQINKLENPGGLLFSYFMPKAKEKEKIAGGEADTAN
jgi:hypothetical protein